MFHYFTTNMKRPTGSDRVKTNAVKTWAKVLLRVIALMPLVYVFLLSPAKAGQRCWPVEKVVNAHTEQGDEIILTFRSRMREGSFTIIYLDPSDGVVTEVAIDSNGVACIFDVGDELRLQKPGQAIVVDDTN